MTDQALLLAGARQRDPEVLAAIYETYAPKIYAYIYRHVGDPYLAEDLTSSVFLKMLEALRRERFAQDALQAWLYRIAHNLIIDHARQQQRRPTGELHEGLSLPPEADPDHLVGRKLQNEHIRRALAQLTPDQREVIILRFGEGMTAPQVAQILGKSEEAVRALQRRGLANLRHLLSSIAVTEHEP